MGLLDPPDGHGVSERCLNLCMGSPSARRLYVAANEWLAPSANSELASRTP